MKKAPARRPADFVHTALPDERLWELWTGIEHGEAQLHARRRRLRQAAASAAVLGCVILGLWLARPAPVPEAMLPPGPTAPRANPGGTRQLSLSDGSTLSLLDGTRAHVEAMTPAEVRVRLDQGSVECEVPPVPQRRFVVEAAGFEVVVKGTHFTVTLGIEPALPTGVTVSVERGRVEVRQAADQVLALLGPGQHWASERNGSAPAASSDRLAAAPSAAGVPVAPLPVPSLPAEPPPLAPSATSRPMATPAEQSARVLFERANTARLAGNAREAAAAFDQLRRHYPSDARAGYAAFMLGRLELDTLAAPDAAVDAFSFALAHPGSGFFREDAQARLVESLARAGRDAECRQAQRRFLADHPQSAQAGLVAKQCDAR